MNETPKQYLYHLVPENIKPDEQGREILYPLNMLREKFPGLYKVESEKYNSGIERKTIPEQLIPTLEKAAWGDVVHLTAIHPQDLKKALIEAGFTPKELKFYQVDPNSLDPKNTTIYLYQDDGKSEGEENYADYNSETLDEHAAVPENTKQYYKKQFEHSERPFLFVGVPHIFHKGPIDVSNFPVISTE